MPRIPHVLLTAPLFVLGCQSDWGPSPGGFSGGGSEYVGIAPDLFIDQPVDGDVFGEGQVVTVMGRVDDPDNTLEYQTFSLASDASGDLPFDVTIVGENAFTAQVELPVGAHALTFTVEDSWGNTDEVVVSVEQLDNQPPTAPAVQIIPQEPVSGQALFLGFSEESVDPEGNDVSYSIVWARNGEDLPEYEDASSIPEGLAVIGDEWSVRVRATDGLLWSDESTHAVTVDGSGPAITVEIAPDPATAHDTLVCTWEAHDPDGEEVVSESARWYIDAVDAGDGADPLSGVFAIGDTVACEVTAESSQPNSANAQVVIENAVPVVETVTLGGAPANESSTLTCEATGSDLDGDALNFIYTWYVDSVATTLGSTLDGSDFDKDDEVWCTAQADDGTDTSEPVESEHTTIENSPPSPPTVTLTPEQAIVGQELTCAATGALDPDPGDTLTVTYAWSVDGALDSGATTDVFATAGLDGGDTVTCEIEVDDGSASASADASVILGERLDGEYIPGDADVTIKGEQDKGYFGHTVAAVGDVDADGTDDLFVAAPGEDDETGAVYLFSGADLSGGGNVNATDAAFYWVGASTGDALGDTQGISAAGDIDGDGTPDLLASAHYAAAGGSQRGEVYLLGSSDAAGWGQGDAIDGQATLIVQGGTDSDRLGEGMGATDLDGDGLADLTVSAPYEDTAANAAGLVAVFYGATTLTGTVAMDDGDVLLTGAGSADRLGLNALGSLGDVDGDGDDDLFLGAYNADNGNADDAGVALFLDGGSVTDGVAEDQAFLVLEGESEDDNFALSGAGLDDVDGDGNDDVLIGARFGDVDVQDAGSVYFFYGGVSGTVSAASADASWGGSEDGGRLGWDIDSADLDGDGALEWTTGAYNNSDDSTSAAGQGYLLLGSGYGAWTTGAAIEDDAQAVFTGNTTAYHYVGRANTLVGDLNGDGFGEWAVGGEGKARNTKSRAGFVYVVWGP